MRIFLLLVLFALACGLSAEFVDDSRYNFRATIPPGFQPLPSHMPRISESTIHAYYLGDLEDDQPDVVIGFENLGGVIGREKLDESSLPPGVRGMDMTFERAQWEEFEIDLMVLRMADNGVDMISLAAQVPLKPEAIQVNIAGPQSQEQQVRGYMRAVLDNMEGESNWLTVEERNARLVEGVGKMIVAIIVVVAIIVSIVAFSRSRRRPPGYPSAYPTQYPHAPPGPNPQYGQPYPRNQPPGGLPPQPQKVPPPRPPSHD